MEQGFDKELDSLLRRVRGGAASRAEAGGNGGAAAQTHLDADELSAYAEGALPSAARMAAASHLADCDECRGAAVGLVRAAGVEAALEKGTAAEPTVSREVRPAVSLRERLGALFAPRVLGFVAPVLAVSLLGALAFVALRPRQSGPELTRDVQRQNAEPRVGITAPEEPQKVQQPVDANTTPGQSPPASANAEARDAAPSSVATTAGDTATAGPLNRSADEAPPPPAPVAAASEFAVTPQPSQGTGGGAGTGAPPPPKTEPAEEEKSADRSARAGSAAPPQLKEEVTVTGNAQQQNRAANNQTNVFDVQSPDGSRAARRAPRASAPAADEAERDEERADSTAEKERAAKSRRGRTLSELRTERESRGERSAADERSAAGRRFRREGGAWVDVNYKPSMPSTGVRRGTDSYRALVADHPEVERAAGQLSGEFVIVIRGRAYRVRP